VRLNLGCGEDVRPGYTNVDLRPTHPDVKIVDLSAFPWPFEDGSAEEILMLDFLEHFPYRETERILIECHRVLRAGGALVIQVPDAEHLALALAQTDEYLCNRCGNGIVGREHDLWDAHCSKCGQDVDDISEAAMRRLYGGQDYPGNWHHTAFTKTSLSLKAFRNGFSNPMWEEEEHQFKNWNFKGRFVKMEDIW
jgi:hypothetical protein